MTKRRETARERAAKRQAGLVNSGPDGHSCYADQLKKIGPFLWKRAQHNPNDDILIGSARVLHAVWLMLRSCDARAYETMSRLEEVCIEYRHGRRLDSLAAIARPNELDEYKRLAAEESWCHGELPPRAALDRNQVMKGLLTYTEGLCDALKRKYASLLREDSGKLRAERGPIFAAAGAFAGFAPALLPTIGETNSSNLLERSAKIAERWRRRWEDADPEKPPQPSRLLVDALVGLGMARKDVEDWIKPLRPKPTRGRRSPRRDQKGRFGQKEDHAGRTGQRTSTG
jgi:hypothetical protein